MGKIKIKNKSIVVLSVFVVVLGIMTTVFAILYAVNKTNYETNTINLENIYQRSFYDLVDNINNTEIKLSKLISSNDTKYSKKLLTEIQENANNSQISLSYLPISMNGISDTIKFINQLNGYTTTLEKRDKLNSGDIETLNKLHASLLDVKNKLNNISDEFIKGYNISTNSRGTKEDYNGFTKLVQTTKNKDVDFPKMIYDGPFSDTVLNKKIKGLNFSEKTQKEIQQVVGNIFKDSKISYAGETIGKFATYDYNISFNDINSYAQITKMGGKLLTLSSYTDNDAINYTKEQAIKIAKDFAEKQGIKDVECVWSDIVGNDAYVNLAPIINNIIYYPDLIKIKVDLSSGAITGWEATTYYTNHTTRSLPEIAISADQAKNKIDNSYTIESVKLALSPIEEYNQEILTHEIKCSKNEDIYYFYTDVQTGEIVNILKVIQTDNGSLLM